MNEELSNAIQEAEKIWNDFSESIKYKNRYFVDEIILNKIENIIKYSSGSLNVFGDKFTVYRARIGDFIDKEETELKSPPTGIASDGRGNPKGISYFYTATNECTAIAEVRPYTSSKVSVATFRLKEKIRIIDFKSISIWEKAMNRELPLSLIERCLLDIILEFLSKPILPNNTLDYIPLQYITEYVNIKGYDGLRYKSTVADGYNILFFDDSKFELVDKKLYEILDVKYLFKELSKEGK